MHAAGRLAASALCVLAAGGALSAQTPTEAPVLIVADADDDDENGEPDGVQSAGIPAHGLRGLPGWLTEGAETLQLRGDAARFVQDGTPVGPRIRLGTGSARRVPTLQGVRAGQAHVVAKGPQGGRTLTVEVARLSLLDGHNRALTPTDTLHVSQAVTNDDSLPRDAGFHTVSADPHNIRIELDARSLQGLSAEVRLTSHARSGGERDHLVLTLRRSEPRGPLRSAFVRLVGDDVDRAAPGVAGHALRVALRDSVELRWEAPDGSALRQEFDVFKPGDHGGPDAALAARIQVFVLRTHEGGPAVIGRDDLSAVRTAQAQIDAANEVWIQCGIGFGDGSEAAIALVAPPPPSLVAIADGDGFPARGDGEIKLIIGGQALPPVRTRAGATPLDTAIDLAVAIRELGFGARVTRNPRTQYGHGPTADVQVTGADGQPVEVTGVPGKPLSTDRRQRVTIGAVDLGDGIEEFDNMNARAGTLEERALVKGLADEDPTTIDLFIINRFAKGTRQGEAFIEAGAGSIINTLLLDRNGLRQQPTAWTLAHEVGHVLLDEPLHPDNVGPDRPWKLMDSDSSRGTVYGPKRLDADECARTRHESGPGAQPQLLFPMP